jgi:hypothetical protein
MNDDNLIANRNKNFILGYHYVLSYISLHMTCAPIIQTRQATSAGFKYRTEPEYDGSTSVDIKNEYPVAKRGFFTTPE